MSPTIFVPGAGGGEVPAGQVRRRDRFGVDPGQAAAPGVPAVPGEPVLAHDPCDALVVDHPALPAQSGCHTRDAVVLPGRNMDHRDLVRQGVVGLPPRFAGLPPGHE